MYESIQGDQINMVVVPCKIDLSRLCYCRQSHVKLVTLQLTRKIHIVDPNRAKNLGKGRGQGGAHRVTGVPKGGHQGFNGISIFYTVNTGINGRKGFPPLYRAVFYQALSLVSFLTVYRYTSMKVYRWNARGYLGFV